MTTQRVLNEAFYLTDTDPGITAADGTANTWSDIWKYQVPVGTALQLSPANTFSAYLEDTSPAEIGDQSGKVRIQVRDPAESDNIVVYGPNLYVASKEFQERPKKAHLGVNDYVIKERHWLVIQVNDDAAIDASDSYFALLCSRIRGPLE